MMEILKCDQDFYNLFDKIGEGVLYHYEIHYNWVEIISDNFNESNFKLIPIGISENTTKYLNRYNIDKALWEKTMLELLLKNDMEIVKEKFFEELSLFDLILINKVVRITSQLTKKFLIIS
jgi:hypothetical protein